MIDTDLCAFAALTSMAIVVTTSLAWRCRSARPAAPKSVAYQLADMPPSVSDVVIAVDAPCGETTLNDVLDAIYASFYSGTCTVKSVVAALEACARARYGMTALRFVLGAVIEMSAGAGDPALQEATQTLFEHRHRLFQNKTHLHRWVSLLVSVPRTRYVLIARVAGISFQKSRGTTASMLEDAVSMYMINQIDCMQAYITGLGKEFDCSHWAQMAVELDLPLLNTAIAIIISVKCDMDIQSLAACAHTVLDAVPEARRGTSRVLRTAYLQSQTPTIKKLDIR